MDDDEEESFWVRRYDFEGLHIQACVTLSPLQKVTQSIAEILKNQVEEAFGDGLGGTVWAGSVFLARYLRREGPAACRGSRRRARLIPAAATGRPTSWPPTRQSCKPAASAARCAAWS